MTTIALNRFQLHPCLDPEGRPWAQRCYVCDKRVDFKKDPGGNRWIRVGTLVRHSRCKPDFNAKYVTGD